MADFMDIGLFQLENLFLNPNRFLFFDLREEMASVPPNLDRVLKNAVSLKADAVPTYLAEKQIDKAYPLVLVCAAGKTSTTVADDLTHKGYVNVYVVAGGVAGLLSEL